MAEVALVVSDLLARSRLEEAAKAEGVNLITARRISALTKEPVLVIVDLDAPGALDDLAAWRAGHEGVPVTGFVSHVDVASRKRAEELGVNVVTRGQAATVAQQLFRGLRG